ncbi:ribonuclease P protein component [Magnetococcales bacterium HHB-1]
MLKSSSEIFPEKKNATRNSASKPRHLYDKKKFKAPQCFPKAHRLLKSPMFRQTISRGKKRINPYFILFSTPSSHHLSRIGLTVSRRVGNAVVRNRIKRLAREFFRLHQSQLKNNFDLVLIARPRAAHPDNDHLRQSLRKLFHPLL